MTYVKFNRTNLPDLESFIRFEPPTAGHIYDSNGQVLVELGTERREIIEFKDIPEVLRNAILSAEDENFFSHSGVDFSVYPRLFSKMNLRALITHRQDPRKDHGADRDQVFPQGGSTITQQLVRGFFLQKMITAKSSNSLQKEDLFPRGLALVIGVHATNRVLLKLEEMRLSLWIETEMQKRYGSKRRAKEELFARYASFIYMGNGRYGFAAASQFYFGKPLLGLTADDADKAAILAGITKSPSEYAPNLADNQKSIHRRNQILALMVKNNFLSSQIALLCQKAPIKLAAHGTGLTEAPAAVENVLEELKWIDVTPSHDLTLSRLLEGRFCVYSTIDNRIQRLANEALEHGLTLYEKRHSQSRGLIQGSVVVLRNSDAAILAEAGGRRIYKGHGTTYSDFNRVTQSLRQPGSAMKPLVYLAAFRQGALDLDTPVPDEPISVEMSGNAPSKWISNFDNKFEGIIPARRALAESRNSVAIWITQQVGIDLVLKTARDAGIHTTLQRYETTALGASEVTLLELANAYRMMASGLHAEPYAISKIDQTGGSVLYRHQSFCCQTDQNKIGLSLIQEGLRGVIRIPSGTAHELDSHSFPIAVMGKTGTTNNYRDALFLGSTYGPDGITVAVRIGFDDNRSLGGMETGGRAALPVFREIILKVYQEKWIGPAPRFPVDMERNINVYLKADLLSKTGVASVNPSGVSRGSYETEEACSAKPAHFSSPRCPPSGERSPAIYAVKDNSGRLILRKE